jgi:hypothetical protein
MTLDALRATLHAAVMATIQPQTRRDIPKILDALDIPSAFDDPLSSKTRYIESRLNLIADQRLPVVLEKFLAQHGQRLSSADRFDVEEQLWSITPTIVINKRVRYKLAEALEDQTLYLKPTPFLSLIQRLWERTTTVELLLGNASNSLLNAVEQHVVRNRDDWPVEHFFEQLGAFDASDRRFALFIEGLASSDVRPDEESQRAFVAAVNSALWESGIELREIAIEDGFPIFRFASLGGAAGRFKNLIFASPRKPDLRFRDAVNNDVEIVSGADEVLVYDRPLPTHGLRWHDLQTWWAEKQKLDEDSAKRTLYKRLLSSLPENSPPQALVFKTFFSSFGPRIPELPALLPEVWLFWDPKTVRERGPEALLRHRMDFLMLFSHDIRVVIEVDGAHHYTDKAGKGDPHRYAAMVCADRDLRLAGYEVYRFGAAELDERGGPARAREFFEQLLKRYGIVV